MQVTSWGLVLEKWDENFVESLAYPAETFLLVERNWQAFEDSKKRALEKHGFCFVFLED